MNRRYPAHRVKRHRVYTVREAAEIMGCHRRTVRRWVEKEDLAAETGQRPWLIEGQALKHFLGVRRAKARRKLALHELYCFGCKSPREPALKMADYTYSTTRTGMLTALCPDCATLMNKKVRRADLETIRARIAVTIQQAQPRLVSRHAPSSSAAFAEEDQTHANAQ